MSGGISPQDRHRAFWARMARCPTLDALHRELMREAHQRNGAAQSTIDAFLLALRSRGIAALAEPDTERRLSEIPPAQIEEAMERIARHRSRYPDAQELLDALAEQVE